MAWTGFDGRAYTRADFAAHVAATEWRSWKPSGICLHNTAAPRLDQWAESGPNHDARIRNLQSYYETQLGWHAGPHLFISRNFINGFSDLTRPGVHSRCFNATHIGIECVGDYSVEEWDFGDGEKVRDNAVFALATLYRALGLDPHGLVFHKECALDNHDCPGRKVIKSDVIARVTALWRGLPPQPDENPAPLPSVTPIRQEPWETPGWQLFDNPRLAWTQSQLNHLNPGAPMIVVDGLDGPLTQNAVRAFQRKHGLTVDGIAGTVETIPAIRKALAANP